MFSWNVSCTWDATKLVLTVPIHYMLILVMSIGVLILLALTIKSGHGVRNVLILALVLLGYGFLSYSSELTLDRASGTAKLREFQYFHWATHTYHLKDIDRVYVSTGSTTSQLRMQFQGGTVLPISFLDQNGGKEEAAYAANHWMSNGE